MMVGYMNLEGRDAVADQKLASMQTPQNTWKQTVVQASLGPAVPQKVGWM